MNGLRRRIDEPYFPMLPDTYLAVEREGPKAETTDKVLGHSLSLNSMIKEAIAFQ